jgi:hypothetical protein
MDNLAKDDEYYHEDEDVYRSVPACFSLDAEEDVFRSMPLPLGVATTSDYLCGEEEVFRSMDFMPPPIMPKMMGGPVMPKMMGGSRTFAPVGAKLPASYDAFDATSFLPASYDATSFGSYHKDIAQPIEQFLDTPVMGTPMELPSPPFFLEPASHFYTRVSLSVLVESLEKALTCHHVDTQFKAAKCKWRARAYRNCHSIDLRVQVYTVPKAGFVVEVQRRNGDIFGFRELYLSMFNDLKGLACDEAGEPLSETSKKSAPVLSRRRPPFLPPPLLEMKDDAKNPAEEEQDVELAPLQVISLPRLIAHPKCHFFLSLAVCKEQFLLVFDRV